MVVVGIIAALMAALAPTASAQPVEEEYLALQYAVHVADSSIGPTDISPRYLWLDDHRLVVPIQEFVEEREGLNLKNIDIFVVDLVAGTAARVASYDEVFGVTLVPAKGGVQIFFSVIVTIRPPREGEFMSQRVYERYAMNSLTFEIAPTTSELLQEQRAMIQPGFSRTYPEALLRITTNDLYRNTERFTLGRGPMYYWEPWNEYIVGLGEVDEHGEEYTLNLYRDDGSTAYMLPYIHLYYRHVLNFPTVLQMSPGGQFLFLNETTATRSTRRVLHVSNRQSLIYIYGFVDEDPTEHYDTVIYMMHTDDIGAGYEIGEVFELERRIVNGAALSTGPVGEPPLIPEERP